MELNKFPLITVFTELNSGKVYSSPIKLQVGTLCLFSTLLINHMFRIPGVPKFTKRTPAIYVSFNCKKSLTV